MKHRVKLHMGLFVVAALFPVPILAQTNRIPSGNSIYLQPFVARKASKSQGPSESDSDILSVVVYKAIEAAGGGTAQVGPPINPAENHIFKSGERIVVSFTPTFESYVYFINRGPEGTRVIFPRKVSDIRAIMPDQTRTQPLQFNQNVGREELIVVVSRDRLSKLDDAIGKPDKMLDPPPHKVVPPPPPPHKVVPPPPPQKGRKRVFDKAGLIAANPPRWDVVEAVSFDSAKSSSRGLECLQEEGDSSVQVRPVRDEKGSYRFGPGQVGAFSISFTHR